MPIIVYGLNHTSAPVELRERVVVPAETLVDAVGRLLRFDGIEEGLILSTCNRTELLVNAREETTREHLREFLTVERGVDPAELDRHCYVHLNRDAVRHLFRVASSLDSMILGEPQILGQMKEAYATATSAGAVKGTLDSLIRRAFSVAKKVRTETGIARSAVSIAHTAATLARDIFGDLKQRVVLVIGAGEMARLAAQHLAAGGVKEIVVVNRSFQRGVDLARELGGRASPYDRLFEEIDRADVVITSTAAPHRVVRREDGPRLRRGRRGRPLFFVDMGVPRNIDPRINDIDGFYLYDIDELGQVVQEHMNERRKEAICAEAIVERETDAFIAWFRSLQVAPTIVDLRAALQALGIEEFERFRGKFGDLTERQRNLVEQYTAALINKLLHQPIRALKRAAAEQGGDGQVEFLRQAFGLGPAHIEPAKKDPDAGHDEDARTGGKDDGQSETGESAAGPLRSRSGSAGRL